MQTDAEDAAFVLLALQAPVAADLRIIVGSMQNVADTRKDGRPSATRLPRSCAADTLNAPLPTEVGRLLRRNGWDRGGPRATAQEMVVLSRDPERALQISRDDVAMKRTPPTADSLFSGRRNWPHGRRIPPSMLRSWAGFNERFADHTVEIGASA